MNCKEFESMIHELVSRRVTDKTKQVEALEHAGHCLWCALRLDEETKLTESLKGLAGTLQGQRAPVRVEEALLQAFRERTLRAPAPRFGLAGKRLWGGLGWGLVFAATVAIACIVILQWPYLHPRSSAPAAQGANNQPLASSEASQAIQQVIPQSRVATDVVPGSSPGRAAPSPATAGSGQALKGGATRPETEGLQKEQPPTPGQRERQVEAQREGAKSHLAAGQSDEPGKRSSTNRELQASVLDHHQPHPGGQVAPHGRAERAALDESASELTTDFIPLGTCDDSQCMDEATLVRVTLPAEALLAFGLALDNDYALEGFVQADVALGSDGVPFAIRFVN